MKLSALMFSMGALLVGSAYAQSSAPSASPAAPAAASGAVHAVCKDGTPYSGDTLKGACHGHGGVDKKASKAAAGGAAPAAAAGSAPAMPATSAAAPAKTAAAMPAAAAAGGGADKVWANDTTKVYHCMGDKYYGKTKHGEYMSEADAKAKGFHADHGKACAK